MIPSVLVYGARDETFWSGTPYYFASALREFGEHAAQPFEVENVGPKRTREVIGTFTKWALANRTTRNRLFLLSPEYHDCSYPSGQCIPPAATAMVSFSQVMPSAILAHKRAHPEFKLIQYIDATLHDLTASFDWAQSPPPGVLQSLLDAEREAYSLVDRVCAFHDGVADSLVRHYGMDRSKISIEGRGVNLSPDQIDSASSSTSPRAGTAALRMCVVGKDPKRKGVYALIEAIDELSEKEQSQVELTLIGPDVSEIPKRPYIKALGFLQASERPRLAGIMRGCNLGVLLSQAEGHPGSVWEFLTLGVPVWVSALPHVKDEIEGFPAMFEPLPLKHDALVAQLQSLLADPAQLDRLKAGSTRSVQDLGWGRPAASVGRYLAETV